VHFPDRSAARIAALRMPAAALGDRSGGGRACPQKIVIRTGE
jgi:hypothetical protein